MDEAAVERRDRWSRQKRWGVWVDEPRPLPPIADLLSRKGIDLITIEKDDGPCTEYRLRR